MYNYIHIHYKYYILTVTMLPYSGKLSREKTFANFADLSQFAKVFFAKAFFPSAKSSGQ